MELLVQVGNPLSACTKAQHPVLAGLARLNRRFSLSFTLALSLFGVSAQDNKLRILCAFLDLFEDACVCK